jgi:predicted RNA-binding Zn-ribbon protein involved in translation (DUF1610 family)
MKKGRSRIPEERHKDKIEDLKAENRKLRKEIQQLRKELTRTFVREETLKELYEEVESNLERVEVEIKPSCPNCGSKKVNIIEKLMNGKDYYFCQECNTRGPVK